MSLNKDRAPGFRVSLGLAMAAIAVLAVHLAFVVLIVKGVIEARDGGVPSGVVVSFLAMVAGAFGLPLVVLDALILWAWRAVMVRRAWDRSREEHGLDGVAGS